MKLSFTKKGLQVNMLKTMDKMCDRSLNIVKVCEKTP